MAKYKKNQPQPAAVQVRVSAPSNDKASSLAGGKQGQQLMAQQRASFALQAVQAVVATSDSDGQASSHRAFSDQAFKSQVRHLPSMIQVNGFGQAVAFFYAKGKSGKLPACYAVYELVERWLCEENLYSPYRPFATATEPRLLTAITQSDQQSYRHAQAETHALLQWVKRFCEGLIVGEPDAASEGEG